MAVLRSAKKRPAGPVVDSSDRSVVVSDARIDRNGVGWKRKSYWLRQEHLGKLRALAHFEGMTTETLIDRALGEFLTSNWDNSRAMRRVVSRSMSKPESSSE
ncbi:MAG: hypothetical protein KKA42_04255 [candidate division Zixibacteria bacterium]|nr:hypothetical protein [candidate division Zixibacteria bacterium]